MQSDTIHFIQNLPGLAPFPCNQLEDYASNRLDGQDQLAAPPISQNRLTKDLVEDMRIMEMLIDFPGGARVDAHFGPYTVATDQPPMGGGEGSAPTPFSVFLASIGTCAGIYVLGFCRQRGLPTDGIQILQRVHSNRMTGMVDKIDLEIQVPPDFPEKYRDSLIRSAELCAVKKHLENPPKFEVYTQVSAKESV